MHDIFKVQYLNVYGHVLDDEIARDEFELNRIKSSLPKEIGDDIAIGIAIFKNKKYVDTYWRRKEVSPFLKS